MVVPSRPTDTLFYPRLRGYRRGPARGTATTLCPEIWWNRRLLRGLPPRGMSGDPRRRHGGPLRGPVRQDRSQQKGPGPAGDPDPTREPDETPPRPCHPVVGPRTCPLAQQSHAETRSHHQVCWVGASSTGKTSSRYSVRRLVRNVSVGQRRQLACRTARTGPTGTYRRAGRHEWAIL
jgi:hypothetical protein